jgi:hypothetical protein
MFFMAFLLIINGGFRLFFPPRSDPRRFPGDSLDIATGYADVGQFAIIEPIQLAETFIVPTPDPKQPNQARDEIHGGLLYCVAAFRPHFLLPPST